jgi:hypothetical protein
MRRGRIVADDIDPSQTSIEPASTGVAEPGGAAIAG